MKPSQILAKLCKDYHKPTPHYTMGKCVVDGHTFEGPDKVEDEHGKEKVSLSQRFRNIKLHTRPWLVSGVPDQSWDVVEYGRPASQVPSAINRIQ